ncbi:MAG TPA: OmpA family protein [Methylomirabilota bacterium]|nr:OmpA family protein [Methylomirabilota bacterium]
MRRPLLVLLALAAAATGCAPAARPVVAPAPSPARDDLVVLLPARDGTAGALTVTHEGRQLTLDQPHATASVTQQGRLDAGRTTAEEVRRTFGPALDALPSRPVTFLLYFMGNSDELTPESKGEIVKLFAEIAGRSDPEVVVVGHTDRQGTLEYNDALSRRRAERVRTDLIGRGIAADKIQVAGRGEREPLVPTEDEVVEPRNRRVEITVR